MSDSKSSYGEPVDEPKNVDDVVGEAQAGLADADAAGREATVGADTVEPTTAADAAQEDAIASSARVESGPAPEPASSVDATNEADAASGAAWYDRPLDETPGAAAPVSADSSVGESVVTPSEPATAAGEYTEEVSYVAPSAPQPIFVQAPEAPRPRGNRGAAGAIGLLAALGFAVLLLAAVLIIGWSAGRISVDSLVDTIVETVTTWNFWMPVVVFYLAFWLLGAVINRGRWGHWVVWGVLVGVASYFGYLLGALFQAPFWLLTASDGIALLGREALSPYAIISFVLGRELTIWFGAWVSRRGKRMSELNDEAQREYERTLEAGPQLYRG
ncbi:hypothetical protein FHX49_000980 [Microbacterium endophyticum]|uniref:Uncharacterized protein n=1 Tax=Microbacterium endophyticum TaxID=1526412 RepID=A0A7W4YME4_9MICO|nr:ABC transporter [Microbacterium endophyticum]MBB2975414.1 hypothetical protein [Microbacterium endophyticum]NIK35567.1 hypothetical protein [Microbacterium endophyticum]